MSTPNVPAVTSDSAISVTRRSLGSIQRSTTTARMIPPRKRGRHCEERNDEAISTRFSGLRRRRGEIASPPARNDMVSSPHLELWWILYHAAYSRQRSGHQLEDHEGRIGHREG